MLWSLMLAQEIKWCLSLLVPAFLYCHNLQNLGIKVRIGASCMLGHGALLVEGDEGFIGPSGKLLC